MAKPRLRLTLATDKPAPDQQKDPPAAHQQEGGGSDGNSGGGNASSSTSIEHAQTADESSGRAEPRSTSFLEQEGAKASHLFGPSPDTDGGDDDGVTVSKCLSVAKPACLVLDCPSPTQDASDASEKCSTTASTASSKTTKSQGQLPFRYGGLELRVNSRNVELYLTEESTGKERYVVTSRGVRDGESTVEAAATDGNSGRSDEKVEWYKFVIVNRGGPATVTSVRIKLLSVKPADCDMVFVQFCKVKAKLLDEEEAKVASAVGTNVGQQEQQQQRAAPQSAPSPSSSSMGMGIPPMPQIPPGTGQGQPPSMAALMAMMSGGGVAAPPASQSTPQAPVTTGAASSSPPPSSSQHSIPTHVDMGAAISALRMMVSSTEESINRRIIETSQRLDAASSVRISKLERKIDALTGIVEEQKDMITKQRMLIVEQAEIMGRVVERQDDVMKQVLEGQDTVIRRLAARAETEQSQGSNLLSPQSSREGWEKIQDESDGVGGGMAERAAAGSEPMGEAGCEGTIEDIIDDDKNEADADVVPSSDPVVPEKENETIIGGRSSLDPDALASTKQQVMTYRGADDLISFGDADDNNIGALSGLEDIKDEAIEDLLASASNSNTE